MTAVHNIEMFADDVRIQPFMGIDHGLPLTPETFDRDNYRVSGHMWFASADIKRLYKWMDRIGRRTLAPIGWRRRARSDR